MRSGLVATTLLLATTIAHANGRPPATVSIHFRIDHETDVVLGATFGVVLSHDGGASWQWMCEAAVGYGGVYDPRFLWFSSGALFATTTGGLRVSHDGCTFTPTAALAGKFVSAIARGSDNALYVAVSTPTDTGIYKSTDEGVTFPQSAAPGPGNTWWQTLAVAPSDPSRLYVTGWQFQPHRPKALLLFRSVDGGRGFTELSLAGFAPLSDGSSIDVVAISPTDADRLFVRVTGPTGDRIYRSSDGGQSFTKILDVGDTSSSVVVRANGELLVAAPARGMYRSTDGGASFQALTTSPALHAHCLVESASGTLWACSENYTFEHMGVARSTDGTTWTKALRYQDLAQPVACANATPQHACAQSWCAVRTQLGVTANPTGCPVDGGAKPEPRAKPRPTPKGCCDGGPGSGGPALVVIVGAAAVRRRRLRRRR